MKTTRLLILVAAGLMLVAFMCSCTLPKVMTSYGYVGENKTTKTLMERSKGNDKLFDAYMRVCSLDTGNQETDCKDTIILENVNPKTLY